MAKKSDIQYIRLYTQGSSALSVDYTTPVRKPKTKLPKPRQQKTVVLRVDPIALCGLVVAAVMLVLMVVGMVQLQAARQEAAALDAAVSRLQAENVRLHQAYHNGYDLAQIEEMALALGLVPVEQVRHVVIPG